MYVDESGDPGPLLPGVASHFQPSPHYALSGLIIPTAEWRNYLTALIDIRRGLKSAYGFPMRAELHAKSLIRPKSDPIYVALGSRARRVALYKDYLLQVTSRLNKARVISVHLDKTNPKYASSLSRDIQDWAWTALIQRFQTHLERDHDNDLGMIFSDETSELKVRALLRKMRRVSFVPSMFGGTTRMLPVVNIIEDPVMRNSGESYFVQTADLIVHALYRKRHPKGSLKRLNVDLLYDNLAPILVTKASRSDPLGIVDL